MDSGLMDRLVHWSGTDWILDQENQSRAGQSGGQLDQGYLLGLSDMQILDLRGTLDRVTEVLPPQSQSNLTT